MFIPSEMKGAADMCNKNGPDDQQILDQSLGGLYLRLVKQSLEKNI
jgi:hypothetical protein